jgi:uncharacterized protein YjbJ (UPF0337 family)
MVDESRIEGTAQNIGGKIQEAVGDFAGDTATKMRGQANQAAGAMKDAAGVARDEIRGFGEQLAVAVKDQPLAAVALAGGVGLLVGYLLSR